MRRFFVMTLLVALLLPAAFAAAQDLVSYPPSYQLTGFRHEFQGWNNCGPATLTMTLSYFGYADDQYRAAAYLKPNSEDKNVTPWEMARFVNTQVAGSQRAIVRYGSGMDTIRMLLSNDFPVIIEAGYDPEPDRLGWMGHYLLVVGYDDARQVIVTQDSYLGPAEEYSYDYVNTYWRHFNRAYIVVYDAAREGQLQALLGEDWDETANITNALEIARAETSANQEDPFGWFNMGTNFVLLGMYNEAAVAYDQARTRGGGLPWRMMWYQFGPMEAYNAVGRYNETLTLTSQNFNDGGGQWVEETFFYAGQAREALGETQKALENYRQAAFLNPNYAEAVQARDALAARLSAGTGS